VHDDLLDALHEILRDKLHFEITIREVADRAGTSPEMVRYYFGGKDGLIMALLRRISDQFAERMDALAERILTVADSPVQQILRVLFDFYIEHRHVTRVSLSEFQKGKSKIVDEMLGSRSEVVIGRIDALLAQLVEAARYDPGMDRRKMAMTIMTMVTGPVTFLAVLPDKWATVAELQDDGWAAFLAGMIDRQYRLT
jgi:AcrR family transcriptional regulator